MKDNFDYLIKVLLIGESGVGKTCILQQFIENKFMVNHLPTIAIDFRMKVIKVNNSRVKMQLWDTAGQERFNTLTSGFFKCNLKSLSRSHRLLLHHRQTLLRVRLQMDGPDPEPRPQRRQGLSRGQQNRPTQRAPGIPGRRPKAGRPIRGPLF